MDSAPSTDEWWPVDYTPALTVDDWEALLNDSEVFTDSSLEIMKRYACLWWKGFLYTVSN